MAFQIDSMQKPAGGSEHSVFRLSSPDQKAQAEVWPSLGGNCLRWQVPSAAGSLDLLYVAPDWEQNPIPTRSGIPVLFPFPNRIRAGQFNFAGTNYQLPLNDPSKQNAIHGFACRSAWRVVDQGTSSEAAWLTAAFQASIDALQWLRLWPADYRLTLTYRLETHRLHLEAKIENPDQRLLPFGLGYHPYFRTDEDACVARVPALMTWTLENSLPTGQLQPVDERTDLRVPRPVEDLRLDDIYTHFGKTTAHSDFGHLRGELIFPKHGTLRVWTDAEFTELVAFTPPHRKATCLEPYTCVTDAVNLQSKSSCAGWRHLQPGQSFTARVVLDFEPQKET
jgi:aldose 1-epimerase